MLNRDVVCIKIIKYIEFTHTIILRPLTLHRVVVGQEIPQILNFMLLAPLFLEISFVYL